MAVQNIQGLSKERLDLLDVINGNSSGDLVIKNGTLVNVLTSEKLDHDVVIKGNRIAYVGPNGEQFADNNTKIIDATGLFLTPGFIDAHLHIESSMLSP